MSVSVERDDLNPAQPLEASRQRDRERARRSAWLLRLALLAVVVALIVLAFRFAFQDFDVKGKSMSPTIATGQSVLVDKISYDFIAPQRGDVVVFHVPTAPRHVYIKRIVAVPGDTVQVRQGAVWINGHALNETYISAAPRYTMRVIPGTDSDVVPRSEYFVLGDNRNHSDDSHLWGLVPRSDIIGRAILAYWPLDKFKLLTDPSTTGTRKR